MLHLESNDDIIIDILKNLYNASTCMLMEQNGVFNELKIGNKLFNAFTDGKCFSEFKRTDYTTLRS